MLSRNGYASFFGEKALHPVGLQLYTMGGTINEFEAVDGRIPYDRLLTEISPDLLKMELDLGWASVAGQDPVGLFRKNPGRYPLWHVKDMIMVQKMPAEVGNGSIDFKRIFAASSVAGMQYFFVEQDGATHPVESITASYQNLTNKVLS